MNANRLTLLNQDKNAGSGNSVSDFLRATIVFGCGLGWISGQDWQR